VRISGALRITGFAVIALLALALGYAFKSFTPPIFGDGAVAELKAVEVNGDRQFVLIRGHDRSAPVLLFVHGGPGMPAMFLAHAFQRDLERHFVVVHWDQRGAGKSYRTDISPDELSVSALLADLDAVVDRLRERFSASRIWLVGHSHGSYLGALYARRHPAKVAAFVGVGQVANLDRETSVQDAFLVTKLDELELPPDTEITGANREDLLFRVGAELHDETSFAPLVVSGLKASEYSLFDIMNVAKGSSFSSKHMTYDETRDLIADETDFETPVAVFMGVHDMTTPVSLAREYYEAIDAPDKRWIDFENAAHFPHFEEPKAFTAAMRALKEDWARRPDTSDAGEP